MRYSMFTCMDHKSWTSFGHATSFPASASITHSAIHLMRGFVKQSHAMISALLFLKHPIMPLFFIFFYISSTFHTHVYIIFPLPVFFSHWYIICADRCCFSAWISSSSAWMNSHQIKLALTDSDLTTPPLHIPPHTRLPRVHTASPSPHQHLSFYLSFDISAPSVI